MSNAAASKSTPKSPAGSQSSSDDAGFTTDPGLPGRRNVRNLLFLSIVFHILLIPSIFDIYFTSPVVNVDQWFSVENLQPQVGLDGQPRHPQDVAPTRLAKRVVVMVGDGLRADKLFQLYPDPPFPNLDPLPPPLGTLSTKYAESRQDSVRHAGRITPAPFLRGLIEGGNATWGVSHTRVPTESRPGHVSLLAGMYEDPSAVLKGWQHNPVEFDSVFNRSSYSYMFGSPDIIPMFVDGARPEGKVHGWTYGGQEEDFTADAVHLDIWVLERLQELFRNSSSSAHPNLDAQLRSSGTVFFLHLLGLDTTGHAYRPHGSEYYRNIQAVDVIAETVQKEFETFFGDKDTAYIFSADHGMSSRGNHGDGHPDNTRTPLLAWGAGVPPAGPRGNWSQVEEDEAEWALSAFARNDVEQAQIAPLISILAGSAIPGNNVGLLPLPYIQGSLEFKGFAKLAVAREVCQQYTVKEAYRRAHSLLYWPCPGLSHLELKQKLEQLDYLARAHRYARLSLEASMLAIKALDGLKYLQRYDWLILRCVVVAAYLSWMAHCLLFVVRTYTTTLKGVKSRSSTVLHIASAGVVALVSARFVIQRSPITYYVYLAFPSYFTYRLCQDVDAIALVWKKLLRPNWPYAIPLIVAVEGMVLGYFQRRAWTAGYLFIGTLWPLAGLQKKVSKRFLLLWAVVSCLTGLFTTLSVDRESAIRLVVTGSALFLLASTGYQLVGGGSSGVARQIGAIQTVLLLAATIVTVRSEKHLTEKLGLPRSLQILGWALLVLSSATVCCSTNKRDVTFQSQAVTAIMAFAPTFVILSLSYETLFFFCFSASLVLWHELESRVSLAEQQAVVQGSKSTQSENTLTARHMRIAVFFLFFIHFGFFGPQNVASIASFYLEPVYRLIPVFNPFAMSALLLYKILIPFFIVAIVFTSISQQVGMDPVALVLLSSIFSDLLVINFFFLVTDEGSWLDIGQSISHFIIASLLGVFELVLCAIGQVYVGSRRRAASPIKDKAQ